VEVVFLYLFDIAVGVKDIVVEFFNFFFIFFDVLDEFLTGDDIRCTHGETARNEPIIDYSLGDGDKLVGCL
jgi:hypothetical protein